jgi:hypothetical protein
MLMQCIADWSMEARGDENHQSTDLRASPRHVGGYCEEPWVASRMEESASSDFRVKDLRVALKRRG